MFRIMLVLGIVLIYLFCCPLISTDAKLLGYWAFEDKNNLGKDSSPNRNHGEPKSFIGEAKWTDKGKVKGALQLANGQETWLEVPHHESLNVKTGQITMMCWVKFTDPGAFTGFGEDGSLIWKNAPFAENKRFWTSYALRLYRPGINRGSFSFDANMTEARAATIDPDFPLVVDEWYHVAGVADGTKVRVYTNGKEKAVGNQRGVFQPSDDPLTIGFDLRDPNEPEARHFLGFVRGIMDEVVILDHALTAGQIKEAMELGEKGKSLESFQPVFGVEPQGKLAVKWGEIKMTK
ncbi:hypothetical protein C6502_20095 [Candidatus Poribacteria bacterium]|nr:MAG: hypothetical protein C6502_20095 [Candidatus Poribacteria bacterium]